MSHKRNGSNTPIERLDHIPQQAPGHSAAIGHVIDNSIPLSIFPIAPDKIVICFCGMPGRGKTHISRRLGRYLSFFHALPVVVYNVSEYRRRMCGALKDAEWFDPSNAEAQEKREACNKQCIVDMIKFFTENSTGVAIVDSTNPTHARRMELVTKMQETKAKVMFIEVSNENKEFLSRQIRTAASSSPDYAGMNLEDSEAEYRRKLNFFQGYFEPLDAGAYKKIESKWSYMKCDHSIKHFVVHKVKGYMQQKIVNFISNLRTDSHPFFLSRHGQSEYNDLGRIGGDSGLTQHGLNYAQKLAEFVDRSVTKSVDDDGNPTGENELPARLWTSTMRRTKETAQFIRHNTLLIKDSDIEDIDDLPKVRYEFINMKKREWFHLDELFAGQCDGLTYEEIEEQYPEEWERRNVDKLAYRYPRGESYLDVIARLEPMIIEMERHTEPLLIVAHQGILRIIYAFYMGYSRAEAPYLSIPLNTVIELVPGAFTCQEQRYVLYTPMKPLTIDGQDEPSCGDPPSH
jgi:broad specificity phosphatase PhoE